MSEPVKDTNSHLEKTPVPEWAQQVCNDFGVLESGAPRYRIIWNPDRTRMCFGREIRKYPRLGERWILEVLLPWEIYGLWDEYAFGPKPADGEYCHTHTIQQTWEGEINIFEHGKEEVSRYLSLEDFGQDSLRLLIQCIEKGKAVQAWQVRDQILEMMSQEDAEFHRKFEDVYDNAEAERYEIDKLAANSGLHTSLDPIPKQIEMERRAVQARQGKKLIH